MSLSIQEIERFVEEGNGEGIGKLLAIFLASLNDWPSSALTLQDYVNQIEETIGGVATKRSVQQFLEACDLLANAWRAEALAGVLELYEHYDENASLREIAIDLENKLKKRH